MRHRQAARPQGRSSTSTTARTSGASPATARARSATSRSEARVGAHLAPILPGVRPDRRHRGGADDRRRQPRTRWPRSARIRTPQPGATIVCKRGPMGCVVFEGAIPARIEDGVTGPGFPVEVYNVLGAGDAFMSGFLRGWLRDEPLATCCAYANACGAFAVSRLLCSAEYRELRPSCSASSARAARTARCASTRAEPRPRAHHDGARRPAPDHGARHRPPRPARSHGGRGGCLARAHRRLQAAGRRGRGAGRGRAARASACCSTAPMAARRCSAPPTPAFWIGRPVERPGSRPLDFEGGGSLGAKLIEWPVGQTVKCLCFYASRRPARTCRRGRSANCCASHDAARTRRPRIADRDHRRQARRARRRHGGARRRPALRPRHPARLVEARSPARQARLGSHRRRDPCAAIRCCRGIMRAGAGRAGRRLAEAFRHRRGLRRSCKGFAVGRTIFAEPARAWLAGRIDDAEVTEQMARAFRPAGRGVAGGGPRQCGVTGRLG